MINCPHCNSDKIKKAGRNRSEAQSYRCMECGKYSSDAAPENGTTAEFGDNYIKIVCSSPRMITQADLVKQFKVDLNEWRIEKWKIKTSEGYRKDRKVDWTVKDGMVTDGRVEDSGKMLVVPLFHAEMTLVRKIEEVHGRDAIAALMEDAKKVSKRVPYRFKKNKDGLLLEIDMPDIHFGRQTWAEESGENSDLKITYAFVKSAMADLLSRSTSKIERILFPIGNDFFNVNSKDEETIHGTRQQEDTRWQKTFREGRRLLVELIDMCYEIAPVDVIVIPGNHDEERMFYVGDALDCWYHNNKNVDIDNRAAKRKYYLFHKNLIGFTHGYYEKPEKLAYIMATEVPEWWSKSKNREWHLGDKHQKKDSVFFKSSDGDGIMVRILRSLAAIDTWTFDKGFISSPRAAEAFLWHPENGICSQFTTVVGK